MFCAASARFGIYLECVKDYVCRYTPRSMSERVENVDLPPAQLFQSSDIFRADCMRILNCLEHKQKQCFFRVVEGGFPGVSFGLLNLLCRNPLLPQHARIQPLTIRRSSCSGDQHSNHCLKGYAQAFVGKKVFGEIKLIFKDSRANTQHPNIVGYGPEPLFRLSIKFCKFSLRLFRWSKFQKRHFTSSFSGSLDSLPEVLNLSNGRISHHWWGPASLPSVSRCFICTSSIGTEVPRPAGLPIRRIVQHYQKLLFAI